MLKLPTTTRSLSSGRPRRIRSSLKSSDYVNVFPGRHTREEPKIPTLAKPARIGHPISAGEKIMSKIDPNSTALPRRGFIQKAAAGLGAAALGGIGAKETPAANLEKHWDLAADVGIVGSGAAGAPASISAAEQGASVIVIE